MNRGQLQTSELSRERTFLSILVPSLIYESLPLLWKVPMILMQCCLKTDFVSRRNWAEIDCINEKLIHFATSSDFELLKLKPVHFTGTFLPLLTARLLYCNSQTSFLLTNKP